MNNRNRPDVMRILGYIMLGLLIAGFLAWRWGLIPSIEAAPEAETASVTVHGGLPNPMPEVRHIQTVNDADIDLVVKTIACEAPHEPIEGIIAVASVIRTRVEERGLTYEQVVTEHRIVDGIDRYQFSCMNPNVPRRTLSTGHYLILAWITEGVMSGELENPFPGANLYYSACLIPPPYWAYKTEYLGQIGCHRFYRSE